MPCKHCEALPRLHLDFKLVYTYIPTHHHEPYLEAYLKVQKYTYESHLGYLLVDVNDFEKYVNDLSMIFNSLEQADVMLLPLDRQKGLTFDALHEQKSLAAWKTFLIDAKDVVYVIENKSVIIEKIESKLDADAFNAIGCHIHQGYYYHKPETFNN